MRKKVARKRAKQPRSSREDDDDDGFRRFLREKAGELRRVAISEVTKSPNGHVKLRKLTKVVLERIFTERERGAGSWKELASKEPQLIQALCKALKHSRKVKLAKGEVHLTDRRTEGGRKSNQKRDDY